MSAKMHGRQQLRRLAASRTAAVPSCRLAIETLEPRRVLSATASDVVDQFAWNAYEHMQEQEGNLFFSPLSVATALAMTSAGAAGQTAAEMRDVLGLGDDPAIHESFGDLMLSTLIRTITVDDFELRLANAIWPQLGLTVKDAFADTVTGEYRGAVQGVDYASPAAAENTINSRVAGQTAGRITDLVSGLGPDTLMVLTNTVYFNALWDIHFVVDYTHEREFSVSPTESVYVPMMYGQPDAARTQIDGHDVLELPMAGGDASMVLVLTPEFDGALSSELLAGIDTWLDAEPARTKTIVEMPRFETTVETRFDQMLMDLGIVSAFGSGADFSGMFDVDGAYIQKVFHKATLEVTEQGTEASAATEVEIALCFEAGTPVRTPDGSRAIQDLQVGDLVLSRSENDPRGEVVVKAVEEVREGNSPVLELVVGGKTVRVTDLHPFYHAERGWTPAGELAPGDWIATDGPEPVEVESVRAIEKAVPVFNLRVADYHTYFVGEADWRFALWTHNFYDDGFYADRPFHLLIRDNVTDTIAFMGRINDPTQTDGVVTPRAVVAAPIAGDYDGNGLVDRDDLAAWKAAYGQTGANLAADGNGDGAVDSADYVVWRNAFAAASASQAEESGTLSTEPSQAPVRRAPYTSPVRQAIAPTKAFRQQAAEAVASDLLLLATDRAGVLPVESSPTDRAFTVEDPADAADGVAQVMVGVRSAVWAPLRGS